MVILGLFVVSTASFAAYEAEKGTIRVTVKTLVDGKYKRLNNAKVSLLSKNKMVKDTDKSNSKGRSSFDELTAGKKYRVACKKSGYVNAKDVEKSRYVSSPIKVKSGKTVNKSCKLVKVI